MHFPKFWARGESGSAVCWRWSETSLADAQAKATARAAELERLLEGGRKPDRYGYLDRPMREQVLESQPGAAITRNAYGAQILNTERAMFVDVDFHGDESVEGHAVEQLRRLATEHGLGTRIYRTAGGLRGLVTSRPFDPKAPETAALLGEVGCDPLYIRLCQAQQSFRARLTPKPWRIEMRPPRERWPFADAGEERALASWVAQYEAASRGKAVCKLLEHAGPQTAAPELAPIVALHDARCVGSGALA